MSEYFFYFIVEVKSKRIKNEDILEINSIPPNQHTCSILIGMAQRTKYCYKLEQKIWLSVFNVRGVPYFVHRFIF